MAAGHNLFISYDLRNPGRNYEKVAAAIQSLGTWSRPNLSLWFVASSYSASQARDHVWASMDVNDRLIVIDAKTNEAAWQNLEEAVAHHIRANWTR